MLLIPAPKPAAVPRAAPPASPRQRTRGALIWPRLVYVIRALYVSAMNANDFGIHGTWQSVQDGQEYEAVAKTKESGRIIARATAHLSLDTADALDQAYGSTGRAAIESAVNDTCGQLALGFPG